MAVRQRRGSPGRIHHSDREAQYTCGSYQQPYPAPLEIETTLTTWS
jgi:transposase InsO family protein